MEQVLPVARASLAAERTLPAGSLFAGVLTEVARGATVACTGGAAVGAALALAAGASQAGSWVAVAGQASLGLGAAHEAGVELARLVAVPGVGFDERRWGDVLGAMIDGFDVIVVGQALAGLRAGMGRRVQARLRARGAIAITIGAHPSLSAEIRVDTGAAHWDGIGAGYGVARARHLEVEVRTRRNPFGRHATLCWPMLHLPYSAPVEAPDTVDAPGAVEGLAPVVPLERSA